MRIDFIVITNLIFLWGCKVLIRKRSRRYKKNEKGLWETKRITAGTEFMERLSEEVKERYKEKGIKVSGVEEEGEGEQKMFKKIRENERKEERIMIYGMDADLIMLSLLNVERTKGIRIYREEEKILKIEELKKGIEKEIGEGRIKDYILICYLLGNDFMPGIVSLRIKGDGMSRMLKSYKGRKEMIKEGKIDWLNVIDYIKELSKSERKVLIEEEKRRERKERKEKEKEIEKEKIPSVYRMDEKYINVEDEGWEERYRKRMLDGCEIKEVVKNYLEGIEWTYNYYTEGCKDWLWEYKYKSAPLLLNIREHEEYKEQVRGPYTREEQLKYVLPKGEKIKFNWAYKDYLWESSITILPPPQNPSQNP